MTSFPTGWKVASIGEVTKPVEVVDWMRWPRPDFIYVDIGSIDNSTLTIASPRTLPVAEAPSRARQVIKAGDTVFSTVRTYLRNIGYVTESLDGQIASTGFAVLRPDHAVMSRYLYYYVQSSAFIRDASAEQRGVSYPAVTTAQVRAMAIPVPPLVEQEMIVAAIEAQFSRIDAGMASLAKGDSRASTLRRAELRSVVNGELLGVDSREWKSVPLPDLGVLDRGKSRHRPRNDPRLYGGRFPFVQTGDVTRANPWIEGFSQTYNDEGLAQSRLWPPGTLCITIAANIAKTGLLRFEACFPDSVVGFIAADGPTVTRWVELVIRSLQSELEALAPATAQKNINLAVLRRVPIPLPPLAYVEQAIAEHDRLLTLIDVVEACLLASRRRADGLRQSILAAAFQGRLVGRRTIGELVAQSTSTPNGQGIGTDKAATPAARKSSIRGDVAR